MDFKTWSKQNKIVAEFNEPLVTKDSRERLHDTSSINDLAAAYTHNSNKITKLKEYFYDTLVEFEEELDAQQIATAFVDVLKERYEYAKTQYLKAKCLLQYFYEQIEDVPN